MAGSLRTILFLGSTREGRMGLRVTKFMKRQLEAANHIVDLCGTIGLLSSLTELATTVTEQSKANEV